MRWDGEHERRQSRDRRRCRPDQDEQQASSTERVAKHVEGHRPRRGEGGDDGESVDACVPGDSFREHLAHETGSDR